MQQVTAATQQIAGQTAMYCLNSQRLARESENTQPGLHLLTAMLKYPLQCAG